MAWSAVSAAKRTAVKWRVLLTAEGRSAAKPATIAGLAVGAQALQGFTAAERLVLNALLRRAVANLGVEVT